MSVNIANFSKLSELVSLASLRKPKIVLNPEEEYYIRAKRKQRTKRRIKCKYNYR